MIQVKREDSMSIHLLFDNTGLTQILESLKSALKGEQASINGKIDALVISMKKGEMLDSCIEIEYTESGETQLLKQSNQVLWILDKEDIEVAIERLEQCKTDGYFSPAEFIRVQIPKNKKMDYIYCELKT